MKGVEFMIDLQRKLQIPDFIVANSKVTYETAVAKKLDTKHNVYALACATIYMHSKRMGVNLTLNQLCQYAPITREEVMNAYEELRKMF